MQDTNTKFIYTSRSGSAIVPLLLLILLGTSLMTSVYIANSHKLTTTRMHIHAHQRQLFITALQTIVSNIAALPQKDISIAIPTLGISVCCDAHSCYVQTIESKKLLLTKPRAK